VDNLLISPDGRICLVECKLWHNPEAVREVVAQILSYASALSVLDYDELLSAVRQTLKQADGDPISDRVLGPDAHEEDRESFIDAVSRSLRLGNFLLLVVGDGIRSGVQQIAKVLQNSALGFSFGLIEMALYGSAPGEGPYYLQPRVLARTEIITRTVFVAGDATGAIKITNVEAPGKAETLSEKEFFDQLGKAGASLPDQVRAFIERCTAIGCTFQLRRKLTLYADDPTGGRINLGGIGRDGSVEFWGAAARDDQYGEPVGHQYMERVAGLLPGARIKDDFPSPGSWNIRYRDRVAVPLLEMLSHQDAWLAAIQFVIDRFRTIEQAQEANSR
jgi:hypothetical protein